MLQIYIFLSTGGMAIAVPGLVKGLWTLHQDHGRLNWSVLIEPSIKLAEDGFKITKPVASTISKYGQHPNTSAGLR